MPVRPENYRKKVQIARSPVGQICAIITRRVRRSVRGREVIEEVAGTRTASLTTQLRRNLGFVGQHLDDDADAVLPTDECLLVVGHLSKITGQRRLRGGRG